MKLSRIRVNNWHNRNFDFVPGQVNYLFKNNGYGKTSLLDAIRYGLTGALPQSEVRNCSVELIEESTGLDIYRERGDSTVCKIGGPSGKKLSEKKLNEKIEEISGVSLENIQMISSSDVFSHMKPDEFLGILLKYIPEQLTYETVISYIPEFTDEMDNSLMLYLGEPDTFGIGAIDECCAAITESRKNLKASYQRNKQVIDSMGGSVSARTLEEIETELIDLQVRERIVEDSSAKLREYEALKLRKAKQEERIAKCVSWLESNPAEKPDPQLLDAYKKERAEKETIRKSALETRAKMDVSIQSLEKTMKELEQPVCPISEKLTCTTDKTKIREELKEALDKNRQVQRKAEKAVLAAEKRLEELTAAMDKYYADDKAYNTYLRVANELKMQKESLVILPEKPASGQNKPDFEAKKRALNEEKESVMNGIRRRKLEAINKETEASIETCTRIINALADKGPVKKGIIDYYVQIFENACNAKAGFAPGFHVSFVTDNGVKVYAVTPQSKEPVYYMGMSSGEKIIVTFLVIDMLNQLSGLKMAFIDNLEQLDRESLESVHNIITSEEFLSTYDHVFVCGVNNKDVLEVFSGDNATMI